MAWDAVAGADKDEFQWMRSGGTEGREMTSPVSQWRKFIEMVGVAVCCTWWCTRFVRRTTRGPTRSSKRLLLTHLLLVNNYAQYHGMSERMGVVGVAMMPGDLKPTSQVSPVSAS